MASNNFYAFSCKVRDGDRQYYAACQARIARIRKGEERTSTDCCEAFAKGRCPAMAMIVEELSGGVPYYLDRDDAGRGITSRLAIGEQPRTDEELRRHREIAKKRGLRVTQRTFEEMQAELAARQRYLRQHEHSTPAFAQQPRRIEGRMVDIVAPEPVPVVASKPRPAQADLASMISEAVAELKEDNHGA